MVYWLTFGGTGILVWISLWKLHTGVYLLLGSASTRIDTVCWQVLQVREQYRAVQSGCVP